MPTTSSHSLARPSFILVMTIVMTMTAHRSPDHDHDHSDVQLLQVLLLAAHHHHHLCVCLLSFDWSPSFMELCAALSISPDTKNDKRI